MDPALIKEITNRVLQIKQAKEDESVLAAHLDAIADVYETDRKTVESIARKVIAEQVSEKKRRSFNLNEVTKTVWVSALVLVMISVVWLLYRNTQIPYSQPVVEETKSEHYKTAAYVAEALSAVNVLKVVIAEHHANYAELPSSFSDMGVNESEFILNKYINRLALEGDSTTVMTFSQLIGEGYYAKIRPISRIASFSLEWECVTNLTTEVVDLVNACTVDI